MAEPEMGAYYVLGPTLRTHLLLDNEEWWGDEEMCAKYVGRFDALPEGVSLGQEMAKTVAEGSQGYPCRAGRAPFYKFVPNMNIAFSHEPCEENLCIQPLWLEAWHLNLIERVGPGKYYTTVVHLPNAHGFSRPTFLAVPTADTFTKEQLDAMVDEDDFSLELRCELPLRHPLKLLTDTECYWKKFRAGVNAWCFVSYLITMVSKRARPDGPLGKRFYREFRSDGF